MKVHSGWLLAAFASELPEEVNPISIGNRKLVAVRRGDDLSVYDAVCPHRGADLGHGGRLDGACLVCPFHGKRVTLGDTSKHWSVPELPSVRWGQALFVRLSDEGADDRGFADTARAFAVTHPLVPALTGPVRAPAELIVENAFDTDHFTALHKVHKVTGMDVVQGNRGELGVEGEFLMHTSPWQDETSKAEARYRVATGGAPAWNYRPRFWARAFSPGVVVTEFGPEGDVHVIVTTAVPTDTGCIARIAVGVQSGREHIIPMLVAGSHKAFEEDVTIWEHLSPDHAPQYDAHDQPVLAYHQFCRGFANVP